MAAVVEVDFYNTYLLRKRVGEIRKYNRDYTDPDFNDIFYKRYSVGSVYTGIQVTGAWNSDPFPSAASTRWYVEESRIKGGFNNTSTGQGVRAYLDDENPLQQHRINTLIYSGIYNSRTGINQTNVFSVSESITKSLDISHGSIQKTYAEQTNLLVFQENKIHRALIDKDTIYTSESGTQTQAGATVIGQFVPYKGDYGISKNPESFAIYNYRKYFTDKSRNAVMRLSNDGLTEISSYGMQDYFRDTLAEIKDTKTVNTITVNKVSGGATTSTIVKVDDSSKITTGMTINGQSGGHVVFVDSSNNVFYSQKFNPSLGSTINFEYKTRGKTIGGWDIHNKSYILSLQKNSNQVSVDDATYKTLSFDERINGWVSFLTFKPNFIFNNLNKFYSIQNSDLYIHHHNNANNNTRGDFYGVRKPSSVTFVFNTQPNITKNFNTIFYEGSNGWEVESFNSGFTGQDTNPAGSGFVENNDSIVSIKSYNQGSYVDGNTGYTLRAGFDRKENRYVSNLRNNSTINAGEVLFGAQMSGIKGYFATVKIKTDETSGSLAATDLGGPKELWAAGTNFVLSSY